MIKFKTWYEGDPKKHIAFLEEELFNVQHSLIRLVMPEKTRQLLYGLACADPDQDILRTMDETAEKLIEVAPIEDGAELSHAQIRVFCPLCHAGSFTKPEGLRRHLLGWGNTHECSILRTAFKLGQKSQERKNRPERE
jgi:hypothetical protein